MDELKAIRTEYDKSHLSRSDVDDNPFDFFRKWMKEAVDSDEMEPSAMHLSTVNDNGQPSGRIVLLKGLEDDGFTFYTNYTSRKAEEMKENGHVALTFLWSSLHRQVRICGQVEKVSEAASRAYFQSRPKGSQIGAWASSQSDVMKDHNELMDKYEEIAKEYDNEDVLPLPPFWGGYRVIPNEIEFWQGRPSRLHDRFRYTKEADSWKIDRLWP